MPNHADCSIEGTLNQLKGILRTNALVTPTNVKQVRLKFFEDVQEPIFEYKLFSTEAGEIERLIEQLQPTTTQLSQAYDKLRINFGIEHDIINARGDKDKIRSLSQELYGAPSNKLVHYAERLLQSEVTGINGKLISPEYLANQIRARLELYRLGHKWKVEFTKSPTINVNGARSTLLIPDSPVITDSLLGRVLIHEVDGHVLHSENGSKQTDPLFQLGFPGYVGTEEGINVYLERKVAGNIDDRDHELAARVIAVDSVVNNLSFKATYDRILSLGGKQDMAFGATWRAHRAGGFCKDHIYLQGFQEAEQYFAHGGAAKDLYVGKISFADLPLVRSLAAEGKIDMNQVTVPDLLL